MRRLAMIGAVVGLTACGSATEPVAAEPTIRVVSADTAASGTVNARLTNTGRSANVIVIAYNRMTPLSPYLYANETCRSATVAVDQGQSVAVRLNSCGPYAIGWLAVHASWASTGKIADCFAFGDAPRCPYAINPTP